jgi:hypothetical protein
VISIFAERLAHRAQRTHQLLPTSVIRPPSVLHHPRYVSCSAYNVFFPALFTAAHRFLAAAASLARPSGLRRRLFLRTRFTGDDVELSPSVDVAALLGGRPRRFGAVPSIDRTCAMCCWIRFFCSSKPLRAAVSNSCETAGYLGIGISYPRIRGAMELGPTADHARPQALSCCLFPNSSRKCYASSARLWRVPTRFERDRPPSEVIVPPDTLQDPTASSFASINSTT